MTRQVCIYITWRYVVSSKIEVSGWGKEKIQDKEKICIPLDKRVIKQQKSDSRKILAKATLECVSVHAYFERLRFRCSRSRACCCRTIFDLSCIQQFWRADCSIEHTSHSCVLYISWSSSESIQRNRFIWHLPSLLQQFQQYHHQYIPCQCPWMEFWCSQYWQKHQSCLVLGLFCSCPSYITTHHVIFDCQWK